MDCRAWHDGDGVHSQCGPMRTAALLHDWPLLRAMAVVTLLYGLGALPLGGNGWNLIGLTILAGAIALCCLPELFLGKYRKGSTKDGDHC